MKRLALLLFLSFLALTASAQEPEQVENVTLTFDSLEEDFIVDSEPIESGETVTSPDYPYILSVSAGVARGIVDYGEFVSISREDNSVEMVQSRQASFIIPFYTGDENVVNSRQELIEEREFLNTVNPSFSFHIGEVPIVRLSINPGYDIDPFDSSIQSGAELKISSITSDSGGLVVNLEVI